MYDSKTTKTQMLKLHSNRNHFIINLKNLSFEIYAYTYRLAFDALHLQNIFFN